MSEPNLELRMNINAIYGTDHPDQGMLVTFVDSAHAEEHLNGDFRNLVKYVMNSVNPATGLSDLQRGTYNSVREKLENESGASRMTIKLYDEDNHALQGQSYPAGDIYLEDIVRDKVGDETALVNMGIDMWSSVG